MKIIKLFIFILFTTIVKSANGQNIVEIKGTVLKFDSTKYYNVFLVKRSDTCQVIVVLSLREGEGVINKNCKKIQLGISYKFIVHGITAFKDEEGINILLNFRGFRYGDTFSLAAGEYPYLAHNVMKLNICE